VSTQILILAAVLRAPFLFPLEAEELEAFTFNIGGGVSAPLNPMARFVGVNGNFRSGAGFNINKNNSIEGDFMWNVIPQSNGSPSGSVAQWNHEPLQPDRRLSVSHG
jgi:hypothetical protein